MENVATQESQPVVEENVSITPDADTQSDVVDTPAKPQAAEEFTPNYKFKVYDQEKEFDDFIKPIIKDKETYAKVKELYEKAHGLDYVKPKYQKTKTDYENLNTQFNKVNGTFENILSLANKKDLRTLAQVFGFSGKEILSAANQELNYLEMSPEQRQDIERRQEIERQNYTLMQQNQQLQQHVESNATQARQQELDFTLSKPEYSELATLFPDFRNQVIEHASLVWTSSGKDLTAAEAVASVAQRYQPILARLNSAQTTVSAPQTQQQQKTIPNIGQGSSQSPIARKIRRISDLQTEYNAKFGG